MKGILVFKSGSRLPMADQHVGCQRFHQSFVSNDGRRCERIFEADAELEDGAIVYREAETHDVTERYAKAAEEQDKRFWDIIRRGLEAES